MPKRALGHLKNLGNWAIPISKKTCIENAKKEQGLTQKHNGKENITEVEARQLGPTKNIEGIVFYQKH